eukprot:181905-Amphidinium_carterae.2
MTLLLRILPFDIQDKLHKEDRASFPWRGKTVGFTTRPSHACASTNNTKKMKTLTSLFGWAPS